LRAVTGKTNWRTDWPDGKFLEFGLMPPRTRAAIPGDIQTVPQLLVLGRTVYADRIALVDANSRLTYAQLAAAVEHVAGGLWALGLRPGERLAASLPNSAEMVIAFLASQRLGLIWTGVNRALAPGEKSYIIEDVQARALLCTEAVRSELLDTAALAACVRHLITSTPVPGVISWEQLARLSEDPAPQIDIDPWAPAGISHTSGTTGRPKGAVHSQHSLLQLGIAYALCRDDRAKGLRTAVVLPMTTLNMFVCDVLPAFRWGGSCICIDRADTATLAGWFVRERVQHISTVPTIMQDLLTNPQVLPGALESLVPPIVGASVVPQSLRELYKERFAVEARTGYGLTEAPSTVSATTDTCVRTPGGAGRPYPHLEIRILGPEDQPVPAGQAGEICITAVSEGPWADVYTPMAGYWRKSKATAEALRDGMLHTGDIGRFDEAGQLIVMDRMKDMIIRGGTNIYPAEIERALQLDPRVASCAVVGQADARLGEIVAAYVQPAAGVTPEQLLHSLTSLCQAELARFKIPAVWVFVADMPRNAMRKIVKARLAQQPVLYRADLRAGTHG
jgi:acyl-CoA synthetase (AMP-forming)/AMP-acid ligase II